MTQLQRDEILAKVLHLKDLVSYQDGAVASRMIVNKKSRDYHHFFS